MHHSFPMALFWFTHPASIMSVSFADSDPTQKYRPWLAFFLLWALFNEVLSHLGAGTPMRLT
jgi:hypothetical protein